MKHSIQIILLLGSIILGVFILGNPASAAVLNLDPPNGELYLNEEFIVTAHLNSEHEIINAAEITLTYPADMLEVTGVSRGGSFLTLWIEEPAVDDEAGTVTFIGGIPNGSLIADGIVASVTFRSKVPGGIEIGFDDEITRVFLNDGQGTTAKLSTLTSIFNTSTTLLTTITSPTHPDENTWYQTRDFTAEWDFVEGAEYSYMVSSRPDSRPDDSRDITSGSATFFDLPDGIHYFILKERLQNKSWRIVGKRRVMIDTTPPLPFIAEIVQEHTLYGGKNIVTFSTSDFSSGLDRYDIVEGGTVTQDVSSPYVLKDQSLNQSVIVWAIDRAGNKAQFSFDKGNGSVSNSTDESTSILVYMGMGALVVLIILFFMRQYSKKEKKTSV